MSDDKQKSPSDYRRHHMGDGRRFHVRAYNRGLWQVYGVGLEHIAECLAQGAADMVALALEQAAEIESNAETEEDADICGLCGEPGADKMALKTGGGVYWPGEAVPDTDMVHQACEREETRRAHAQLTQSQRDQVLREI